MNDGLKFKLKLFSSLYYHGKKQQDLINEINSSMNTVTTYIRHMWIVVQRTCKDQNKDIYKSYNNKIQLARIICLPSVWIFSFITNWIIFSTT